MAHDQPRYYSTATVAQTLEIPRRTVQYWIAEGRLTAINVGTEERPRFRVSSVALATFCEVRQLGPAEVTRNKAQEGATRRWSGGSATPYARPRMATRARMEVR